MADIRTAWIGLGGDWRLSGPSLDEDDGLETGVVISLFTDRVADNGEAGVAATARRGWWGDAYADASGDRIGSRLWLLAREKRTAEVMSRAELYAREALQWLITDGVARSVAVTAEAAGQAGEVLALAVTITRSARPVVQFRFESFWKGQ
ncbi:phage GP46 family protein [Roseateles sp. DXS20W]|uniref:Phage GP46 family protein n=1 Tax=Pelomonas lactea TaxID=3299030 RepID=A0ABW7GJW4_9BURK